MDAEFERILSFAETDDELRERADAVIAEIRRRMEEETLPAMTEASRLLVLASATRNVGRPRQALR